MCTALKHALVDHHEPAYLVAYKIGRNDTWLSRVARGIVEPSEFEKSQISRILGKTVEELFPPHAQLILDLGLDIDPLPTEEATK
jgi:hypothetical protein